jgi:hypothetical protein
VAKGGESGNDEATEKRSETGSECEITEGMLLDLPMNDPPLCRSLILNKMVKTLSFFAECIKPLGCLTQILGHAVAGILCDGLCTLCEMPKVMFDCGVLMCHNFFWFLS